MSFSKKCYDLVESNRFQYTILMLIIINAGIIGLETFDWPEEVSTLLYGLDALILWVFILEIILRLIAHGSRFLETHGTILTLSSSCSHWHQLPD